MNYVALIGGEEKQVEVIELSADQFQITIDGQQLLLDARVLTDTTLSLLHEHNIFQVKCEPGADSHDKHMLIRGNAIRVEVLDLRSLKLRKAQEQASGPEGPAAITSPMPGKVVEVFVEDGQEVQEGQGLLVIEAMKMENELRAPRSGVVKQLGTQKGATVEGGVALCVIE